VTEYGLYPVASKSPSAPPGSRELRHRRQTTFSDVRGNVLLALVDAETRSGMSSLVPVQLQARQVLHEPGTPALFVYFPVTAVVSLMSMMEDGSSAEVSLIGREGMLGLDAVFGTVEGPTTAVVQIAGSALRMPTATLRTAHLNSAVLRQMLDLYSEARFIQVAQTAACNRLHPVEARLGRWLLDVHDRIEGNALTLQQEFIGQMLGVQRPTISTALGHYQQLGLIEYRGRTLNIVDRAGIEAAACECYATLQREFERLFRRRLSGEALPPPVLSPAVAGAVATAALKTMRDITGRLLLATLREQQAREEAELANQAKDQFLELLSHELRTGLNAILGWCTVLADQKNPAAARGLAAIERNASGQLKMVEDLLDVARAAAATADEKTNRNSSGHRRAHGRR
jgi:CRP-like cAMP-binding protein